LDFQGTQETPTNVKEGGIRYLGGIGSSEGIIDKVTIDARAPSAFNIEESQIEVNQETVNLFKRRKNGGSMESKEIAFNHSRKQSQLIDLTNQ
jgi:hypothetical protein